MNMIPSLKILAFRFLCQKPLAETTTQTVISKIAHQMPGQINYLIRVFPLIVRKHVTKSAEKEFKWVVEENREREWHENEIPCCKSVVYVEIFSKLVPQHLWPLFFATFGPVEDRVLLRKSEREAFRKSEIQRRKTQRQVLEILKVPVKKEKSAMLDPLKYVADQLKWDAKYEIWDKNRKSSEAAIKRRQHREWIREMYELSPRDEYNHSFFRRF